MRADYNRRVPTFDIDPKTIEITPFEHDPIFMDLIVKEHKGSVSSALTRIHEGKLTAGFYKKERGEPILVADCHPGAVVAMINLIKGGSRPRVYAYWNPHCPGENKLVCPDDQATLGAYRELGISLVPVHLIKPHKDHLSDSAVKFRGLKSDAFVGSIIKERASLRSLKYKDERDNWDVMDRLSSACSSVQTKIKDFHVDGGEIHYHETLFAILYRHKRTLNSIKILGENGNVDHAFCLVRLLYEGFLGFYADWISPDFMGPRLHYVTSFNQSKAEERASPGRKSRLEHPRKIIGGLYDFLESVEQKARFSPLGSVFYDIAYPSLSSSIHQEYNELDMEKGYFVEELGNSEWQESAVKKWASIITTELLFYILNDVGESEHSLGEI